MRITLSSFQYLGIFTCALALLAPGCGQALPTAPTTMLAPGSTALTALESAAAQSQSGRNSTAAVQPDDNCTFYRGTTTCVTTATHTETDTHVAFSGCLYGPFRAPGRRLRTFEDTYLVTETTTTLQHGLNGAIYDSHTDMTRQLVSSRQISDVCEPL